MSEKLDIKLSELTFSARRVRFLHLKSQDEIVVQDKVCGKYPTLFLGADVLSNCPISVPNLPRTHARYSKKGLSTKILFPNSVRISGIQGTSNGVWFYNIQGLFKVAFEIYSRQEQLEILQRLQPLWTIRFGDELLKETTCPSKLTQESHQILNQDRPSVSTTHPEHDINALERSPIENIKKELDKKYQDFKRALKGFMNNSIKQNKYEECDNILSTFKELLQMYKTNEMDIEVNNHERLVCTMCQWIGEEFKKHRNTVTSNATEFKRKHITAINKLPPAEVVIKEIFPHSMIVLLKTWMDVETLQTDSQTWLPFPLIQIVLEFANQTLVSGVSHVLYSRLVRTDSV